MAFPPARSGLVSHVPGNLLLLILYSLRILLPYHAFISFLPFNICWNREHGVCSSGVLRLLFCQHVLSEQWCPDLLLYP